MATIGALNAVLGIDTTAFTRGLDSARSALDSSAARMNEMLSRIDRAGGSLGRTARNMGREFLNVNAIIGTLGIDATAAAFIGFEKNLFETTAALSDQAKQIGFNVEAMQALRAIMRDADGSSEDMDALLQRFTRSFGDLKVGGTLATQALTAFRAANMQTVDTSKSVEDALTEWAKAVMALGDPTKEAAAVTAMLGRNGQAILPVVADIANGVGNLTQRMKDAQRVIGKDLSDSMNESQKQISASLDRLKNNSADLADWFGKTEAAAVNLLATMMDRRWQTAPIQSFLDWATAKGSGGVFGPVNAAPRAAAPDLSSHKPTILTSTAPPEQVMISAESTETTKRRLAQISASWDATLDDVLSGFRKLDEANLQATNDIIEKWGSMNDVIAAWKARADESAAAVTAAQDQAAVTILGSQINLWGQSDARMKAYYAAQQRASLDTEAAQIASIDRELAAEKARISQSTASDEAKQQELTSALQDAENKRTAIRAQGAAERKTIADDETAYEQRGLDELRRFGVNVVDDLGNALNDFGANGKSVFDSLRDIGISVARDLLNEFERLAILDPLKNLIDPKANLPTLGSVFGGLFGGGGSSAAGAVGDFGFSFAASGADASAGQPFIVGEKGPEMFIPSVPGTIVPNSQISNYGSGAQTVHVVLELSPDLVGKVIATANQNATVQIKQFGDKVLPTAVNRIANDPRRR